MYRKKRLVGTTCKKDNESQYDPQVGEAAAQNAATAAAAQAFSEQYFTDYVAPMLEQMTAASAQTQERQDEMFALNRDQMLQAQERYETYGIPAEDRYYDMVAQYSEPEEMERQARSALGDYRAAAANQQGTMSRRMASLGIDPTSPASIAAMSTQGIANTAGEAGAMNRARDTARRMGMALTADAANFGRGGQSAILNFGNAASGNTMGAFGVSSQALAGANQGANVPLAGYNTAQRGYTANLNAYTSLAQADMQAQAASDAGLGEFLGSVGAAAIYMSDVRLKENIRFIGLLPNQVPVYAFEYKDGVGKPGVKYGFMAQDVEPLIPDAVVELNGYKAVNYTKVLEF